MIINFPRFQQLVRRIEPIPTIGSILSVRAFELRKSTRIGHIGAEDERFNVDCVGHCLLGHAALLADKVVLVQRSKTKQSSDLAGRPPLLITGRHIEIRKARHILAIDFVFKTHEQ